MKNPTQSVAEARATMQRLSLGLRLIEAERATREEKPRRNDTGLNAGRDATSCVFSFMSLPRNTRLD